MAGEEQQHGQHQQRDALGNGPAVQLEAALLRVQVVALQVAQRHDLQHRRGAGG